LANRWRVLIWRKKKFHCTPLYLRQCDQVLENGWRAEGAQDLLDALGSLVLKAREGPDSCFERIFYG